MSRKSRAAAVHTSTRARHRMCCLRQCASASPSRRWLLRCMLRMGSHCRPPARGQPGRVGQERVMQHQVGVAPTHIAPVRSGVPMSCKGLLRVLPQPVPDNSIAIRNRSALARRLDSPLRPQSTVTWDRNSSYRPLRVVLRRQLRASIAPVRPLVISVDRYRYLRP